MAVTVVKRPTGHKIIDQAIAAAITNSGGDALITFPYHGLGTGDTIYITSDIDEYNGFWYVTSIDSNTFKISEYATADFVEYYQDADIDFYQTNEHDWNSIFLPIVYKCSNNRWPVNSVNGNGLILLNSDDNGYTSLFLAAPLSGLSQPLQYVKISGAASADANDVWQVVEIINNVQFVIDMPSSIAGSLIGAAVQYYYNNYQVKVKIYAGLPASHTWQAKKPYEEVGELSLTPDEDNVVMFSVAEYIKMKVAVKNNTTLFSLPLNLDAFTGFYIATSEAYDDSDGYTITRNEDIAFTDDTFEGYAIAGKLPFKNVYSGDYADYVYTDASPALWLTAMDRLLAVEDKYFDVSFIKNIIGAFNLVIDKYVSDYLTVTETIAYADHGVGVYRIPITPDSAYDSFCVRVTTEAEGTILNNSDFANNPGAGPDWSTGVSPSVTVVGTSSDLLWISYPFVVGNAYSVTINYNNSTITIGHQISVRISDNSFVTQFSNGVEVLSGSGNFATDPIVFVATASTTRIAIRIVTGGFGGTTVTLLQAGLTEAATIGDLTQSPITQEICIDILESCEVQGGFTPTDIRLLEDGSYRLLE